MSRTSSIEGYWFQAVHSTEYPYSVICIEFDPATKGYVYHGINYRADFCRNALFRSTSASVGESGNNLTFHFDAAVRVYSDSLSVTETAKGYGNIKFMTEGSSSFVRGFGEFFERKPEANWHTFELHRISSADVCQALGREYAADNQDYDRLLMFELDQQMEKRKSIDRGNAAIHLIPQPRTDGLKAPNRPAGALDTGASDAGGQQLDPAGNQA